MTASSSGNCSMIVATSLDTILDDTTRRLNELMEQLSTEDCDYEENISGNAEKCVKVNAGNEVIKKVLQFVQKNPDSTEVVAHAFFHWFENAGLRCCKLPLNESQIHEYHPLHPLNASCEDTQWIVWKKLCLYFQQQWLESMFKLKIPHTATYIDPYHSKLEYYIDCLSRFYEPNGVWKLYQRVRRQHVSELLSNYRLNVKYDAQMDGLTDIVSGSVSRDVEMFLRDTFLRTFITVDDVKEVYTNAVLEHVDMLLKELQSSARLLDAVTTNHTYKYAASSPDSKEIVLLSQNEEIGSTESVLPKVVLQEVATIIVNCWLLELCLSKTAVGKQNEKGTTIKSPHTCGDDQCQEQELGLFGSKKNCSRNYNWDWRATFSRYTSDLAQWVDEIIRIVTLSSLEQECVNLQQTGSIETVEVCYTLAVCYYYPHKVSASVAGVVETIDELLPLVAASEEELFPVQSAFGVAVKQYTVEMVNHILRLSQEALNVQNTANFNVLLTSAAYLQKKVQHYNKTFKETLSRPFQGEYVQLCELLDTLVQQAVTLQRTMLPVTVLQDRDSHNWSYTKPFFEDEKVSFSVQMWNMHMHTLQQDLWAALPATLAQRVFVAALEGSLTSFTQHYASVKPSYARVRQLRADITAILLCASEFLLSVCQSLQMSNVEEYHVELESVHQRCSALLATMAIVTSPLNILYKVFKKGFPFKPVDASNPSTFSTSLTWLSIYQPEFRVRIDDNSGNVPTSNILGAHLEMMCLQPAPIWPLVLKLLIMRDFTLSILMLSHSVESEIGMLDNFASAACGKHCCGKQVVCLGKMEGSIWPIVINILSLCRSYPKGLSHLLFPLIERFNLWFVICIIPNPKVPKWFEVILYYLEPTCISLIRPVVAKMLVCARWETKEIDELHPIFPDLSTIFSESAVAALLVENVLKRIVSMILSLPSPLLQFFAGVESEVPDSWRKQTKMQPVTAQVVVSYIYQMLNSPAQIQRLLGIMPSSKQLTLLKIIADDFLQSCIAICADLSHPLNFHFQKLKSALDCVQFNEKEGEDYDETDETFFKLLATEVTNSDKGSQAAMACYKTLLANSEWILSSLGLEVPDTPDDAPQLSFNQRACKFNYNSEEKTNPFCKHGTFGRLRANHAAVIGFQYDWLLLLQSNLGLATLPFRFLLSNRWEMQDAAQLDGNEIKAVHTLQAQFGFQASGMQ